MLLKPVFKIKISDKIDYVVFPRPHLLINKAELNLDISNNNTYLLYKRGWNGINIDLDKKNINLFNISRPKDINLNYAISDKESETDLFFYHDASPINTLSKNVSSYHKAKIKEIRKIFLNLMVFTPKLIWN